MPISERRGYQVLRVRHSNLLNRHGTDPMPGGVGGKAREGLPIPISILLSLDDGVVFGVVV